MSKFSISKYIQFYKKMMAGWLVRQVLRNIKPCRLFNAKYFFKHPTTHIFILFVNELFASNNF